MCSQRTHTYTQHSILHSLDYFVLFCFFWVRTLASTRDANKMIWKSFVSYVDTVHGVPSICIINWNLWCCVCVKKQRCLVYKKRVGTQRRIELCAVGSSLLVLRGTLSCVVHGMAIRCRCLVVRIRIIELSRLPTNICAVKKARCVCANRQGRCRHITTSLSCNYDPLQLLLYLPVPVLKVLNQKLNRSNSTTLERRKKMTQNLS